MPGLLSRKRVSNTVRKLPSFWRRPEVVYAIAVFDSLEGAYALAVIVVEVIAPSSSCNCWRFEKCVLEYSQLLC